MRLTVASYVPSGCGAVPPGDVTSEIFVLRRAEACWAGFSEARVPTAGIRPDMGELINHFQSWHEPSHSEFLGFETANRPLFLDPMLSDRLWTEFPSIAELRRSREQDWRPGVIHIGRSVADDLWDMRGAFSDADHARLRRWLSKLDVIVPAAETGADDPFYRARFGADWPAVVAIVQPIGIFAAIPEAIMLNARWPRFNSYILRRELFLPFAESLFEALARLHAADETLIRGGARQLAERLFGIYLQFLRYRQPLLRVAHIPVLLAVPDKPPAAIPEDFDADGYLALNPDVASARMDATTHFMRFGWRELREWAVS
jgi:hypothetical protein